jgi:antitoxin PrlF
MIRMVRKDKNESCYAPIGKSMSCCKVEALISVDERGQMVLPKDLREKANIRSGDKLAVVVLGSERKVCCITLIKAEDFAESVKGMLGPLMGELVKK